MADCTKTVEFLREWNKMCSALGCGDCPANSLNNGHGCVCSDLRKKHPDETIAIVQKWSDEHPVMTWAGKFKELLPNAKDDTLEIIMHSFCPSSIFGAAGNCECDEDASCADCWAKEYKEATNDAT